MKNKLTCLLMFIACALILIVIVLFINNKDFTPPKIDSSSKIETPKYVDELGYKNLKVSSGYNIAIAGKPKLDGKYLFVYFTSDESSKYLFKLRIYKNNSLIKETGVIEPGHYIEKIKVGSKLSVGDDISYKIMGYEYDTYYSAGEVSLNVRVW